jgi:two-component system, LytTR family, sensor kinase
MRMPRALAFPLAVLTGWALVAAVFAIASSLTLVLTYQPPQWGRSIATAVAEWAPWAAFTPVVMWLARRYRPSRRRWVPSVLALAPAGLVVVFFQLTLTRVLQSAGGSGDYIAITNVATQYFIYLAVVVSTYALDNYREGRARELTAAQLETALAEARLQLLRMQLQPHFLFNTLNTIAEMVHDDPRQAERMIAGLSALLRETLDAGAADLIALSKELQVLDCYVSIQQVRFGERLRLQVAVDDAARDALVPSLILQPLVENAIKHGLAVRRDAGRIELHASREDGDVVLRVADNGPGFSREPNAGIGLANTRGRLRALFGEAHRVEVATSASGTAVTIRMPFRTASGRSERSR